jgi:hypothetical protein
MPPTGSGVNTPVSFFSDFFETIVVATRRDRPNRRFCKGLGHIGAALGLEVLVRRPR